MKRGFTMIELIFVIVILGILAAVAIPKLAATRTDAQITKGRADVKTMEKEIQGYVLATGQVDNNLSNMSQAIKKYEGENEAVINTNAKGAKVMGCVDLNISENDTTHDINLTVSKDTNNDIICQGIQKGVFGKEDELKFSLKGKRVNY